MDITTQQKHQDSTVQVGWRVPSDLAKEVRKAAIDRGVSAQDFVTEILRAHFSQKSPVEG